MKHILNNLSEEEKNAIREQHAGGMKVMTENFSKLINSKLGDSKPLVNEQASPKDSAHHSIYFDIKSRYLPFGFKENKFGNDFISLTKGDDSNGAFVNLEKGKLHYGITINGKTILDKTEIPDGTNERMIFNNVIKQLDKYKNYKFNKTPYQG